MTQGKVRIEMELDGDKFTVQANRIEAALSKMEATSARTSVGVDRIQKRVTSAGQTLKDFTLTLSMASGAINNLHNITSRWMVSIIQTNAEIERMTFLMKGMSSAATETEKMKDAEKNVAWIFDFAKNAPFSMKELTDSFVKFKSVGLEPLNGSMRALVDAVAAFGGNDQILHRASVAIQQMAGKGVISMEELRQQLGEAVPNAINLMARSMGKSYGQLVEDITKGTVDAKNALENMFAEFDRVYGGSAQRMMLTFTGSLARLKTEWMEFQLEIGKAGFFDEAKKSLLELIHLMNSPMSVAFAEDLGKGLNSLLVWVKEAITWMITWRHTIIDIAMVLGTFWAVVKMHTLIDGLVRSLFAANGQLAMFKTSLVTAGAGLMAFTRSFLGATTAASASAIALTGVGSALKFVGIQAWNLLPIIGSAIAVVWTLIEVFGIFGSKSKEAFEEAKKGMSAFLDAKQLAQAKEQLQDYKKELDEINRRLDTKITPKWMTKTRAPLEARKAELEESIRAATKGIEDFTRKSLDDAARKSGEVLSYGITKQLAGIQDEFNKESIKVTDVYKDLQKKTKGDEEKYRADLAAIRDKYYADSEIALRDSIEKMEQGLREATASNDTGKIGGYTEAIRRLREQLVQLYTLPRGSGEMKNVDSSKEKVDKYTTTLRALQIQYEKLTAKLNDYGVKEAEVREKIEQGQFTGKSQQELDLLIATAKKIDDKNAALKLQKEELDRIAEAMKGINTAYQKELDMGEQLAAELMDKNMASTTKQQRRFAAEQRRRLSEIPTDASGYSEAEREASAAIAENAKNETRTYIMGLREKTQANQMYAMNHKEALEAQYRYEVNTAQREAELWRLTGDERKRNEEELNAYLASLSAKHRKEMEGPIESLARKWKDSSQQMQEAGARWLESWTDAMVEFAATGKINFTAMTVSILKDILRIQIQASMAKSALGSGGWMSGILGIIGSMFGSSGGYDPSAYPGSSGGMTQVDVFHKGGIAGRDSGPSMKVLNSLFAGAPKFHTGGMPGLKSDEMPAILRKGEGVFTKEQMKALGGGQGEAPKITINMINQTGTPAQGQQGDIRFDGEKWVLDIIMKNVSRPGEFREGMKMGMAQ